MASRGEPLSPADHAAWLSARAWGGRPWDRLAPSWRGRLLARPRDEAPSRDEARATLRADHQAHAALDFDRVHHSWLVRALQGELPAVRRAVVARLDATLRDDLRNALAIPPDDLDPPLEPLAEALDVAGALWTERLVGGPEHLPDDPPVIQALAQVRGRSLTHLVGLCALAKRAYLQHDDDLPGLDPHAQRHLEAMRAGWQHFQRSTGLELLARHDLRGNPGVTARDLARIGLLTPGRLLATADPIRTRWALQHLPYAVAKPLRAASSRLPRGIDPGLLLAWEGRILAIAGDAHETVDPDEPDVELSP